MFNTDKRASTCAAIQAGTCAAAGARRQPNRDARLSRAVSRSLVTSPALPDGEASGGLGTLCSSLIGAGPDAPAREQSATWLRRSDGMRRFFTRCAATTGRPAAELCAGRLNDWQPSWNSPPMSLLAREERNAVVLKERSNEHGQHSRSGRRGGRQRDNFAFDGLRQD